MISSTISNDADMSETLGTLLILVIALLCLKMVSFLKSWTSYTCVFPIRIHKIRHFYILIGFYKTKYFTDEVKRLILKYQQKVVFTLCFHYCIKCQAGMGYCKFVIAKYDNALIFFQVIAKHDIALIFSK